MKINNKIEIIFSIEDIRDILVDKIEKQGYSVVSFPRFESFMNLTFQVEKTKE